MSLARDLAGGAVECQEPRIRYEEPVANGSSSSGLSRHSLSIGYQKAGPSPWLRQIGRGRAILAYRDLPPGTRVRSRVVRGRALRSIPRSQQDPG